ncbi:MAG: MucB/RseB C-terminal domain-containing protein [Methylococcales bacterium]|nr:MucB/RseB C-terminal domain-containing protein [Methylococcales bacterium]
MPNSFILYLSLVVGILVSSAGAAEELSATALLENLRRTMLERNFKATAHFFRDGTTTRMDYQHGIRAGKRFERMLDLDGHAHEVLRHDNIVTCWLPQTQRLVIDHRPSTQSFLMTVPERLSAIQAYYRFQAQPDPDQANWIIDIIPEDAYRYARKVWLTQDTYLPLKIEVYNEHNRVIERVELDHLQPNPQHMPLQATPAQNAAGARHIHQDPPQPVSQAQFVLTQTLPGYQPILFTRMPLPESGDTVEHLLLSDGFSSLSVYREKHAGIKTGLTHSGSVNAYSKTLPDGSVVTVIGEVPAQAVRQLAEDTQLAAPATP